MAAVSLAPARRPAPARPAPAGATPIPLALAAVDGAALAAHHVPAHGRARGAAVIAPAMGVPQRFYAPLAGWLAELGLHVVTFDYRGTGASQVGRLRDLDVDIVGWARLDATAALRAALDLAPGLPVTWIGHSLGGQIVPWVPDHRELARVITIAAGSGYWRENAAPLRRKVWLFWWALVPALTPLFGYFPGRRLGMVGDLPRGVIRQWRRWCMDPDYAVGAEGPEVAELYARVKAPITALSFTDDEMMSERNTARLHAAYVGAPVTHARIAPADLGLPAIGHFGCLRPALRAPLWERHLRPALALG